MGAYLSEPVKTKYSDDYCNNNVTCGCSSMQGWRTDQEDAHICILDFDTNASLFAVFDGHGGFEVAKYAAEHLPNFIKRSENYKNANYKQALIDAFMEFDKELLTVKAQEDLVKLVEEARKEKKKEKEKTKLCDKSDLVDEDDEEVDENVVHLYEEAAMPIEKVIEKYRTQMGLSPCLKAKKCVTENKAGCSTSSETVTEPDAAEVANEKTATAVASNGQSSSIDKVPESPKLDGNAVNDTGSSSEPRTPSSSNESKKLEMRKKRKTALEFLSNMQLIQNDEDSGSSDEEDKTFEMDASSGTSDDDDDVKQQPDSSDEEAPDDDDDEDDSEEDGEAEGEDSGFDPDFLMKGVEKPGYCSGCTAVVALLIDNMLYVANAGDSRCVVCRKGQAEDLSLDHKPEDELELDRIRKAGGKVIDGRVNHGLNLSRAFGDHNYKLKKEISPSEQMISAMPDVKIWEISKDDEFVILACDGIWNSLSSQEVADFVRARLTKVDKMSQICEEMFDKCLAPNSFSGEGEGCDNMTAVIVKLNSQKRRLSDGHANRVVTDEDEDQAVTATNDDKRPKIE